MVYEERNIWSSLIVSILGMIVYVIVTLQQPTAARSPRSTGCRSCCGRSARASSARSSMSIVWGIIAGMGDPEGVGKSDQRDRDIARMGNRVGTAFLVIAGLGVIVLCAVEADWFWIANTMYFGFAISAIVGGIASVIAYRRGLA